MKVSPRKDAQINGCLRRVMVTTATRSPVEIVKLYHQHVDRLPKYAIPIAEHKSPLQLEERPPEYRLEESQFRIRLPTELHRAADPESDWLYINGFTVDSRRKLLIGVNMKGAAVQEADRVLDRILLDAAVEETRIPFSANIYVRAFLQG